MAEAYEKKTQLEHVLLRPDAYIGSTEPETSTLYVPDADRMIAKDVTYVPGLLKIVDEILVNAIDNHQRDNNMNSLKVSIDDTSISITNNGKTIPVTMHKEGCYVPELLFGHLLTGSNFDDTQNRTVGGRNGLVVGLGVRCGDGVSSRLTVVGVRGRGLFVRSSPHCDTDATRGENV